MPICNMILRWPPSVGDIYFPFLLNLAWPCNLLWSTECYSRDSVWVPDIDIKSLIPLFPLWSLCSLLAWAGAGGAEWVADQPGQRQILSWAVSLQCPWKPTTESWLSSGKTESSHWGPPSLQNHEQSKQWLFSVVKFLAMLVTQKKLTDTNIRTGSKILI